MVFFRPDDSRDGVGRDKGILSLAKAEDIGGEVTEGGDDREDSEVVSSTEGGLAPDTSSGSVLLRAEMVRGEEGLLLGKAEGTGEGEAMAEEEGRRAE